MRLAIIIILHVTFAAGSAWGQADLEIADVTRAHEQADLLMKERTVETAREAAALLQEALKVEPENTETLRRLGTIGSMILDRHAEFVPYLEKGWKLGDVKCLEALSFALIKAKDGAGIMRYKADFIKNHERIRGAKIIGFYIAGEDRDSELFRDLLQRTTIEEIEEDSGLARFIARVAKILVETP